jgi:hypothetical protein
MAEISQQQALEELKKRGLVTSSESVLEEEGTTFQEFKKGAESLLKGSAKGIVDIVGGWGNLYDYLRKSPDPSALSSTGILKGIRDLGGPDLQQISGYRGAFEFGQSAAPAAAMSAAGLPGLFGRTPAGLAGEFGVAGTTGVVAQQVAPDSPWAQLAIQASPYALRGGVMSARKSMTSPTGQVPTTVDDLLRVGRMTPGEATGSRVQLATEARIEAAPSIEAKGTGFRQAQAQDVSSFLDSVFKRASSQAVSPEQATTSAFTAFNNYGKALTGQLRSQASRDFGAAKSSGGKIDTTPVVSIVSEQLANIPPEIAALAPVRNALQKIIDEYSIPAQAEVITPSTILGPTGQPASVSITPAVPAGLREISIDRLQKNLSAWGDAVYSGKADFGKGNIFEGVAPGQVKGIALSVLRGFRDSLDQASTEGIAGADKLIKARDNFKANLAKIEDYSNVPLTKYFDVETVSALTPEKVIDKLSKAAPSERRFLAEVLQNSPDGASVFDTVRKQQFNQVLSRASDAAAGAAADSPEFVVKAALTELGKRKGDFDYLFTNPKDKTDALLAMQYMQRVLKSESVGAAGGLKGGDVYSTTRGFGGTSQTANLAKEAVGLIRDIVANPNAFADVIFNPDTVKALKEAQQATTVKKLTNVVTKLGDSAAKFAPRVGPMVETSQPMDSSVPTPNTQQQQISPDEALQQLRMMGITTE